MEAAPALFSTRTGWPRLAVMSCAMMRAMTSVGPPAEKPTRSLIGFCGKGCDCAAATRQNDRNAAIETRLILGIMQLIPSGDAMGATIEGLDLSQPLEEREVEALVQALGRHGVVRFPRQQLSVAQQRDFAARFGELEINVASGAYQEPGFPEV